MKAYLYLIAIVLLASCVSQKKYDDLLTEKVKLSAETDAIQAKLEKANKDLNDIEARASDVEKQNANIKEENEQLKTTNQNLENRFNELETTNTRLKEDYKKLLETSTAKSSELSKSLADKEKELLDLEESLLESQKAMDTLMVNLEARERKVQELEGILNQKDSSVQALRNSIGEALLAFEEGELNVEVRNGKVYVSLASQLLFKSFSTQVDPKGKDALSKLAQVVKDKPDFEIIVEGHTDDVPISSSSKNLKDNWDLSVLRATAVTRILTSNGVPKEQILPAGRGPYHPIDPAKTKEARQLNRRTEIILAPKLDELYDVLEPSEKGTKE